MFASTSKDCLEESISYDNTDKVCLNLTHNIKWVLI